MKRGDLLFVIDPRPYQGRVRSRGRRMSSATRPRSSSRASNRARAAARESGAVSQEELDERTSTVAQAEANVAGSERRARVRQPQFELHARHQSDRGPGQPCRGHAGEPGDRRQPTAARCSRRSFRSIRFTSTSRATSRPICATTQMARAGERASSRDAPQSRASRSRQRGRLPARGRPMDFVDNQFNPQTGTIRARAVLDNKDGAFTPGLFARVQLLGSGEYTAILIDDRAVNTDQNQKYVFVLGADNKVEYRRVKLGRVDRRAAHRARGPQGGRRHRRERRAARASRSHGDAADASRWRRRRRAGARSRRRRAT